MKERVRVLLLGAAFSADLHMDAYTRFGGVAEVVGIADKDLVRIEALADRYKLNGYSAYTSFEEAVEKAECDLVDICLPNFLHHKAALLALRKGKDILCEKPLAISVEQGEEMVAAAKEAGRHIYYAEDWLFAPAVQKALALVEEGGIGRPLYIRARECHSGSHSPFAQKIELCGGGSMIHLGIHPIGLLLSLKKNEWTEVMAMTSGGGEKNLVHRSMEGEDWAAVLMRFSDGTTALLEGNYVTSGGMEDVIDIYGTEGCLHIDLTFSSAISAYSDKGFSYTVEKADVTSGWSKPAVDEKYNIGYVDEIGYFLQCCAEDREADVGMRGEDGLEALKVIRAVYESASEGKRVDNPECK